MMEAGARGWKQGGGGGGGGGDGSRELERQSETNQSVFVLV